MNLISSLQWCSVTIANRNMVVQYCGVHISGDGYFSGFTLCFHRVNTLKQKHGCSILTIEK